MNKKILFLMTGLSAIFVFAGAAKAGYYLSAPIFTSPADFSFASYPVTLSWSSVQGANYYDLKVYNFNGQVLGSDEVEATSIPGFTSKTSSGLNIPYGTYTWELRSCNEPNDSACGAFGAVHTFTYSATAPTDVNVPVSLISPADNSLINLANSNVTLSWSSVPSANYYDVWVYDSRGQMLGSDKVELNLTPRYAPPFFTTKTFSSLNITSGIYTWKVRACSAAVESTCGPFSGTRTFVFNYQTSLGVPVLISPVNGSTITSNYPSFQWQSVTGAKAYQYEIWDSTGTAELRSWDTDGQFGSTQVVGTSLTSGTHNWRVRACVNLLNVAAPSDSTCGQWSSLQSFTITSYPVASPILSFSKDSFTFNYIRGEAIPAQQSLKFTNTSNTSVNFKISINNRPSWLGGAYATGQLTVTPGSSMGLGASVNPSGLVPELYTTNIVLTGNFNGSPKNIPVILFVNDSYSIPAYSIPEGALIRAIGDADVWIVKYVGAKKFKRLILNPSVFNSYSHLKWSDVKNVGKSTVDSFTTSDLVRAVGDSKVYKLYPTGDSGQKYWIETADTFNRMGLDWDSIYQINQTDKDSYTTGQVIDWKTNDQVNTTEKKIYLVALEDNGKSGKKIGCGDSLIAVNRTISFTNTPLKAVINDLLSIKSEIYGESGLYNSLYQSSLKLDSVVIDNGKSIIKLSGTYKLNGVCDDPRMKGQIEETAKQFSSVKEVAIFVNDKPIDEVLSNKGE